MSRFTVNVYDSMPKHRHVLEAFGRMVETGDGPVIHPVDAAEPVDAYEGLAEGAQVVAVLLRPEWSEGYINTKARLLAEKYGTGGRLVALVGVPRRRLAPDVQAMVRWVIC